MPRKYMSRDGQLIERYIPDARDREALTRKVAPQVPSKYHPPQPPEQTWMVMLTDDKTLRVCGTENLISTDPTVIVPHLNKTWPKVGVRRVYAVHHGHHLVLELLKRGRFAQKDVAAWAADGFTEWIGGAVWASNVFRLPFEKLVLTTYKVDASPRESLGEALVWKGLLV